MSERTRVGVCNALWTISSLAVEGNGRSRWPTNPCPTELQSFDERNPIEAVYHSTHVHHH